MSEAHPAANMSLETLNLPKEKTYFIIVAVVAVIIWILIIISIVGFFYGVLFAVLGWMANGLLSAHLRAEAVRVDEEQLPELHDTFLKVCAKLNIEEPPHLYVLQAGGVLNAFATRFSGRNFVVVYSTMLESLGPTSSAMQFVLGHELGHIHSNHILKKILLAPGLITPLVGSAYRRACESSCDRYGAFVADDLDGALRAMLVLSGGGGHGEKLDPVAFAKQHYEERGFFVSWHELISGYPTLSARTSNLLALSNPAYAVPAPRNPLAYIFAFFNFSAGPAGGSSVLAVIVMIGLLSAMAIPAFTKVRQEANLKVCRNNDYLIAVAYSDYIQANRKLPTSFVDYIGPGKKLTKLPECPDHGVYTVQIVGNSIVVTCSVHGEMEFK